MKINVVWYGNPEQTEYNIWWDMSILKDLFSGQLWQGKHEFIQYDGIEALPEDEGAVVVIPSRLWLGKEEEINASLQKLRFVVACICGNEESNFQWQAIRHPMLRVWMQLPRLNVHNDVSYKLINGYRPETRKLIKEVGMQKRTIDYAFIGQVNHERRRQCVDVLNQFHDPYPDSVIVETDTFGKEAVSYPEYIKTLARTKITPCPSGVESPDSFRLYEALEAGCLPVVDAFSTNNQFPGFWHYLFGEQLPFPIIPYWSDFPQVLPELLRNYPANVNRVNAWWQQRKRNLYFKLIDDVKILGGFNG